jgi:hypothetical protein
LQYKNIEMDPYPHDTHIIDKWAPITKIHCKPFHGGGGACRRQQAAYVFASFFCTPMIKSLKKIFQDQWGWFLDFKKMSW